MATDVPQRQLRNHTADLLRRVEEGERLRITVHGHPIAELVPIEHRPKRFVLREKIDDPFERHEAIMAERERETAEGR